MEAHTGLLLRFSHTAGRWGDDDDDDAGSREWHADSQLPLGHKSTVAKVERRVVGRASGRWPTKTDPRLKEGGGGEE